MRRSQVEHYVVHMSARRIQIHDQSFIIQLLYMTWRQTNRSIFWWSLSQSLCSKEMTRKWHHWYESNKWCYLLAHGTYLSWICWSSFPFCNYRAIQIVGPHHMNMRHHKCKRTQNAPHWWRLQELLPWWSTVRFARTSLVVTSPFVKPVLVNSRGEKLCSVFVQQI